MALRKSLIYYNHREDRPDKDCSLVFLGWEQHMREEKKEGKKEEWDAPVSYDEDRYIYILVYRLVMNWCSCCYSW